MRHQAINRRSSGAQLAQERGHLPPVIGAVIHYVHQRSPERVGPLPALDVCVNQLTRQRRVVKPGQVRPQVKLDFCPTLAKRYDCPELLVPPAQGS